MPYTRYTWAELRVRLAERYEAVPFWSADEALATFNEALAVWNLCTGRWKRRETLLTVSTQSLYTLSASMVYRMRIEHNLYPLSPSNRADLNWTRPTWRGETTTTGGDVPTRPIIWVPISLRTFYLWPADAVDGNTLTIDGVSATPVLVDDGDTLDLGEEHLAVLLDYALHVLSFGKGGPFFVATQPLLQRVLRAAVEENGQIKTSQRLRRVAGLDDRGLAPLRGASTRLDRVGGREA